MIKFDYAQILEPGQVEVSLSEISNRAPRLREIIDDVTTGIRYMTTIVYNHCTPPRFIIRCLSKDDIPKIRTKDIVKNEFVPYHLQATPETSSYNKTKPVFAKVYLHTYALSSGKIMEIEGELVDGGLKVSDAYPGHYRWHSASNYSTTFEEAVKIANIKRFKRIESLEKQIKKLKALNFENEKAVT